MPPLFNHPLFNHQEISNKQDLKELYLSRKQMVIILVKQV